MKLLYLSLIVVVGATTHIYPSQSNAKKRGGSTQSSLTEGHAAKKIRKSPYESEAKATSAATHAPVPMDIDGKPDKREKILAANPASASAGTPATSQPNEATQKFQQFIDQHIQNSSFKTSNTEFFSTIEDFVRQGADIALAWGPNGETLMHTAAAWRNYRVIIYLHEHHPHLVDVTDNSDRVPLEHCLISPQSVTAKFELLEAHLFSDFAFLHTQERLKSIRRFNKKIWKEFINYRNQQLATPKLNSSDCFAATTPAASHADEIIQKLQQFIDQQIQNGSFVTSHEEVLEKIKDFERQEANLRLCWGPLEASLLHRAAYWRNHAVINYLASNYPDLVDTLDALYRVPLEQYLTSPIKSSDPNDSEAQLVSKFAFLHTQERLGIITPLKNAREEIWQRFAHYYRQQLQVESVLPMPPPAQSSSQTNAAASHTNEITEKLQQFIDQQIKDGSFVASLEETLEQVKKFEQQGANLSSQWMPYGETLMHKAAYWRNYLIIDYLSSRYHHLNNVKDALGLLPEEYAAMPLPSNTNSANTQEHRSHAAATKPDWDSSESDWKSLLNPDLVDNRSQKRTPTKAVPARASESETKSSASASASAAAAQAPQSPRLSDHFDRGKPDTVMMADDELTKLLLDNSPLHTTLATPSPHEMIEQAQTRERQRLALSTSAAPTANQDLLNDL